MGCVLLLYSFVGILFALYSLCLALWEIIQFCRRESKSGTTLKQSEAGNQVVESRTLNSSPTSEPHSPTRWRAMKLSTSTGRTQLAKLSMTPRMKMAQNFQKMSESVAQKIDAPESPTTPIVLKTPTKRTGFQSDMSPSNKQSDQLLFTPTSRKPGTLVSRFGSGANQELESPATATIRGRKAHKTYLV